MREVEGDIWDFHNKEKFIGITTNGDTNRDGLAIMGRGVALQASERFPELRKQLGISLLEHGNHIFFFRKYKLITFPVKHHWRENADPSLIQQSAKHLVEMLDNQVYKLDSVYLPEPGTGAGKLNWKDVKKIIQPIFDDRVTIVHKMGS